MQSTSSATAINNSIEQVSPEQTPPSVSHLSRSLSDIYGSLSPDAHMPDSASVEELRSAIANQRLVDSQRKYFDSGDYAILKEAKGVAVIGLTMPMPIVHARPETIPQKSPGSIGQCCKSSPVRDRVVSADDLASARGNFEALSVSDSLWTITNNNQD